MKIKRFMNDMPVESLQGSVISDEVIEDIIGSIRSRIYGESAR